MYHTKLKPDFRRLEDYLPDLTDEDITSLEASNGLDCYLECMNEAEYNRIATGLKTILEKYHLQDHYLELLYIIHQKNEQIRERYDAYWENYYDDLNSIEIATFLLAYKESDPGNYFQLVVKENVGTAARPKTESASIKDTAIAKWMCEQVYQAIETKKFPLGLFGTKILHDLFGEDYNNPEAKISLEKLKATANLSPRIPSVKEKKLFVEFCQHIQYYLITRTNLTAPGDVVLTDAQANLFFDILDLFRYIKSDKIDSEPKDYMHAMFKNSTR